MLFNMDEDPGSLFLHLALTAPFTEYYYISKCFAEIDDPGFPRQLKDAKHLGQECRQ